MIFKKRAPVLLNHSTVYILGYKFIIIVCVQLFFNPFGLHKVLNDMKILNKHLLNYRLFLFIKSWEPTAPVTPNFWK